MKKIVALVLCTVMLWSCTGTYQVNASALPKTSNEGNETKDVLSNDANGFDYDDFLKWIQQ